MSLFLWSEALQNLFFPNSCLYCGNPVWGQSPKLCANCRQALRKIYYAYYEVYLSKMKIPFIDRVIIAYAYDSILQELFERMKYNGEKEIAPLLGKLAYSALRDYIPRNSLYVPVPLHPAKKRKRGYNQAGLIAKGLAKSSGGLSADCAVRIINTQTQTRLNKEERKKNVSGAFRIKKDCIEKLRSAEEVILVDDVITTGATLNELARTLKKTCGIKITAMAVATPLVKDLY